MVETHEYKGLWWLPSDEAEKLYGTLMVKKGEAAPPIQGNLKAEFLENIAPRQLKLQTVLAAN